MTLTLCTLFSSFWFGWMEKKGAMSLYPGVSVNFFFFFFHLEQEKSIIYCYAVGQLASQIPY